MKEKPALILAGLVLVAVAAQSGRAQVKSVRTKIDGYLCGM
jgi:hypothetical protein